MAQPIDLSPIPVFDHHCHPWLRAPDAFTPATFRPPFSEGVHPRIAADVPSTLYYRWTLRELARVFGCPPDEASVLAARAELGHAEVARRLMGEANVVAAIVDHLFAGRGTDLWSVQEMGRQLGGARTWAALRLERVLEDLVVQSADAGELEARFLARLDRRRLLAEGVVSLKSIIAYRSGLAIASPSRDDAFRAFAGLKRTAEASGSVRIADKALLDYFIRRALAWCAIESFPIQFHTGFGDPDVDLLLGNPLHLRDVLQDESLRDAPFVLLHAGYPYVRESSYLAGVYPNVHVDVGLAIPFAATDYEAIFCQILALAPTTKVLWSSDGFAIPEHCWFAAVQGRRALSHELERLVDRGVLGIDEAMTIGRDILHDNAERLYPLERDDGERAMPDEAR